MVLIADGTVFFLHFELEDAVRIAAAVGRRAVVIVFDQHLLGAEIHAEHDIALLAVGAAFLQVGGGVLLERIHLIDAALALADRPDVVLVVRFDDEVHIASASGIQGRGRARSRPVVEDLVKGVERKHRARIAGEGKVGRRGLVPVALAPESDLLVLEGGRIDVARRRRPAVDGEDIDLPTVFGSLQHLVEVFQIRLHAFRRGLVEDVRLVFQAGRRAESQGSKAQKYR